MSGKAGSFGRALGAQEVLEGLLFCVPKTNHDLYVFTPREPPPCFTVRLSYCHAEFPLLLGLAFPMLRLHYKAQHDFRGTFTKPLRSFFARISPLMQRA